jgi:hypothetical protein
VYFYIIGLRVQQDTLNMNDGDCSVGLIVSLREHFHSNWEVPMFSGLDVTLTHS